MSNPSIQKRNSAGKRISTTNDFKSYVWWETRLSEKEIIRVKDGKIQNVRRLTRRNGYPYNNGLYRNHRNFSLMTHNYRANYEPSKTSISSCNQANCTIHWADYHNGDDNAEKYLMSCFLMIHSQSDIFVVQQNSEILRWERGLPTLKSLLLAYYCYN